MVVLSYVISFLLKKNWKETRPGTKQFIPLDTCFQINEKLSLLQG